MTVSVNITGLEPFIQAINNLAQAISGKGVSFSAGIQNQEPAAPATEVPVQQQYQVPAQRQYPQPTQEPPVQKQYLPPAGGMPTAPASQYPAAAAGQVSTVPVPPQYQPPSGPMPGVMQQQYQTASQYPQSAPGAPYPQATTGQLPTSHTAQAYTQEQLAVAMTGLVDSGKLQSVQEILQQFGVFSLMEITAARYPELALKLREAGAPL